VERHFEQELEALREQLLMMGGRAETAIRKSIRALETREPELATEVLGDDGAIDRLEIEVEERCVRLLALQQPMARDLRFITAALKISNDLERVGDHAVNIAEGVPHLVDSPMFAELPEVEEMARLAGEMLSDALDCFVRADAGNARDVIDRDDRVDQMAESLFRILLTHMMEDPRRIGPSMTLFLVSRNLERIADLATNIAEDVVFLVEGRNIKHGLRVD